MSTAAFEPASALSCGECVKTKPHWHKSGWLELLVVFVGGAMVAGAWGSELLDLPSAVIWMLCGLSVLLTSGRTGRRAFEAVREFKIGVDVLMFVAAAGAAFLQRPVEGAFLLFLFGLGAVGEHMAMRRAEHSLRGLEALAPESAERIGADGSASDVPLSELAPGDLVRVRGFARIPCDAVVEDGTTAIDESTLTGEPIPVEKHPGDPVFAGTLNTGAAVTVSVTRPASESALARVIAVVTEARSRRARVEMLTERVERFYAPLVLVAALLVFGIPALLGKDAGEWFYRSMAFLTAASPCALAIGAPATYLCGVAGGARRGIVFKGGQSLESLARVKGIALDKTGTITTGRPRVHAVHPIAAGEPEVIAVAAALEAQASHPLADAIGAEAARRALAIPDADAVRQHAGIGVEGIVDGVPAIAGSPRVLDELGDSAPARQAVHQFTGEGYSVVVVVRGGVVLGVIGVGDQIRADAAPAVAAMRKRGLRVLMITGDHAESASVIARHVGLEEVHADQRPQDKMARLDELELTFGPVAMVGDGANDAPALARATVSLSMGNAASDVAADNADIAIMGERLMSVVEAFDMARRSSVVMRENLLIALGVICMVAPLAIAGLADLGAAVILHEGSTVVVVLNALRLLRPTRTAR